MKDVNHLIAEIRVLKIGTFALVFIGLMLAFKSLVLSIIIVCLVCLIYFLIARYEHKKIVNLLDAAGFDANEVQKEAKTQATFVKGVDKIMIEKLKEHYK